MCPETSLSLASVFVETRSGAPAERCGMSVSQRISCSKLHRVEWQESFIATGSGRQICHLRAPDAESVRLACRQGAARIDGIWTGTVRDGETSAPGNLIVEQRFAAPLQQDADIALATFRAERLAPLGFTLVRAIIPCHRRRIVCLCDDSDPGTRHSASGEMLWNGLLLWPCRRVMDKPLRGRTAVA